MGETGAPAHCTKYYKYCAEILKILLTIIENIFSEIFKILCGNAENIALLQRLVLEVEPGARMVEEMVNWLPADIF